LPGRQDLIASLTKLHLFRLTQFRKVIYFDADTLILRPLSHLFDLSEPFSASPDIGWPDCFNSGLLVATPSDSTFEQLARAVGDRGSWDGGDQGLLNDFFAEGGQGGAWNRLSYTYNVTPSAYYQYVSLLLPCRTT
jgi:lipopolysaccharide biosynthesis glycosyltransferase